MNSQPTLPLGPAAHRSPRLSAAPPVEPPLLPLQVGPYLLGHPIGRGGTAEVYLAYPLGGGAPVALKVCQAHETQPALLTREALILQDLDHPGVVRLHAVGTQQGQTYLAMKHLEGCTLKDHVRMHGSLPLSDCLDIGIQICEALDYLHGTGEHTAPHPIIHGDIKPANLMIDSAGHVTLIDFGIARSTHTESAQIEGYGTPGYMAPEQWSESEIDGRTDLFMLGVVLFELATGTRMFPSHDLPTLHQSAGGDPTWSPINHLPGTHETELLPFLEILKQCVADVHCRPHSAGDLAEAMRKLQQEIEASTSLVAWTRNISIA